MFFFAKVPFPATNPREPASFSPEPVAGKSRKSFFVPYSAELSPSVLIAVKSESLVEKLKSHLPLSHNNPNLVVFTINSPETVAGKSRKSFSVPSSTKHSRYAQFAVKKGISVEKLKTHLPLSHKNPNLVIFTNQTVKHNPNGRKKHRRAFKILDSEYKAKQFSVRVKDFLLNSSCGYRFFMTWISSVESFGGRELFSIESLFKSHPNGCLIIVSNSMDSRNGMHILRPFLAKGFKVTAVSPDFNYLFKNTAAESWFNQLMKGNVNPGEIPLGQNLSNLLRLGLLYRFGGIYLDTDVIILKNFGKLRNVIGAQTIDFQTGNWSRLNNAVMVFDEGHVLVYKFIEEFAQTFDGSKWGHNGPYLVSRVVSRVGTGYNFTILPPMAFYPVDWNRIHGLFEGPRSRTRSKWLLAKFRQINRHGYALHLWNKQSRGFKVEDGSIIQNIMFDHCVLCNFSSSDV
ncbi:alpha 1 [Abeliophyllum distichum]|uniref:Alpha 1 n=1 Tax=Abeliophyllum distichum TaxID=126358 RepID=A0ABD1PXK3_9LAMI